MRAGHLSLFRGSLPMSTEQPPRRPPTPVPTVPSLGDVRPSQVDNAGSWAGPRGGPQSGKPTNRPTVPDPNWMADRAPPTLHPLGPVPGRPAPHAPQPVPTRNAEVPAERRAAYQPAHTEPRQASAQPPRQEYRPKPGQDTRPTYRPEYGQQQSPEADYGSPPPLRSLRQPEPERQISRGGRIVLWTVLGSIGLLAVGVTGLLVATPVDLVRDQLAQKIKVRTGRDLVVAGKTTLSFFPSIALGMSDVSLSAQPGMGGGPTITMKSLDAKVALMPLLRKQVSIKQLVLRQPVIDLRIDKEGRKSWDFADITELMPKVAYRVAQATSGGNRNQPALLPRELNDFVKSASPDSREATVSKGPLAALEDLVLGDARIERGTIRYTDERTGVAEEVTALDLNLALDSIQSPLDAKGSLIWRAEPVAFEARLLSPKTLSEDRPAKLTAKLSGRPGEATYEGQLTLGRAAEWDGNTSVKAGSLKVLAGWLGTALPEAAGFGPMTFTGHVKATEASLALTDTKVSLDGMTGQGGLTVDHKGPRPMLRGQIQLSELDLNQYALPKGVATTPTIKNVPVKPQAVKAAPRVVVPPAVVAPPASKAAQPAPAANSGDAKSIEDLLKDDEAPATPAATRVRGFTQRDGWNEQLIDLSAFGLVDADLKISLGAFKFQDLKIGATSGTVRLNNRVLKTNIDDMQLYEGRGRGILNVDATLPAVRLALNVSLDGTSAMPLLQDAAKFQWLAGKGRIALALGGQGLSEREIVEGLEGKADFAFQNGQIVGIDIPKLIQAAMQGRFSGFNHNPAEKTDFSEFAGSFVVNKGVAQNNDLRLTTPLLQVTGAGSANMPTRTIDYVMKPKLVASAGAGFEIPVKMSGSWERPTIQPDIGGALKNPDAAINTIKQLGEQFKGKTPDESVNKAKDLLNRFLKPQ
jgi:AsmA protein